MSTQRYQHIFFCKLKHGENFYFGKRCYWKSGFFIGEAHLDGQMVVVMPWRKVRSARPFGKARPPQKVEGGDRSSETIGGSELTPSA